MVISNKPTDKFIRLVESLVGDATDLSGPRIKAIQRQLVELYVEPGTLDVATTHVHLGYALHEIESRRELVQAILPEAMAEWGKGEPDHETASFSTHADRPELLESQVATHVREWVRRGAFEIVGAEHDVASLTVELAQARTVNGQLWVTATCVQTRSGPRDTRQFKGRAGE